MLIHPLVVHFPIALWLTAVFLEVVGWRRREAPIFQEMAYWLVGLGIAGALVSIGAGWIDLWGLEAQGVGTALVTKHLTHSILAYLTTALFVTVFVWRWKTHNHPPAWLFVLAAAGALAIAVTGYLGHDMRLVM